MSYQTEDQLLDDIDYSANLQADARELAAKMWTGAASSDDVRRWIGKSANKRNAWNDATSWFAQRMAAQRKLKRSVRAVNE